MRLTESTEPFLAEIGRFLKTYWIATAIVVIAIIAVIAWVAGYRVANGTIVRIGSVEITDVPAGAQVFVDQDFRGTATDGTLNVQLMPGTHAVIVSASGFQPWETMAMVQANKPTTIDPILFPVRPTVQPLPAADVPTARAVLNRAKLPTAAAPLTLGCALLTTQNNQLIASAATSTASCTPPAFLCSNGSCGPTIVYSPIQPMRAVLAYPGRTDAALVVAGNAMYAVGLDPRAPQAFDQLLSAQYLMAAQLPDGRIVVQNQTGVYTLSL